MFVNVGARDKISHSDIPTKAALKRSVENLPDNTVLYDTSEFSVKEERTISNLTVGVKYSVVGPNPYTSRKWYATVEKLPNGKITVK